MSCHLTTALGRLLCDASLRRRFREDAAAVLDEMDVALEHRPTLFDLSPTDLDAQAATLINKRFSAVRQFLPHTIRALGAPAYAEFARFAETFWPEGDNRQVSDAAAFSRFLRRQSVPGLCRAEANALAFLAGTARFAVQLVPSVVVRGRTRLALQLLFRRGGRPRQVLLYLGLA